MRTLLMPLALVLALVAPVHAEEGHSHDAPAAASTGPALPRFSAVSDVFELVGVVDGKQVAIYLDRFADNSPVPGARLDMEVAGRKVAVAATAPGEYRATLAEELKPGVTPVTATVEAGTETDLLAGDIDVHEDDHHDEAAGGWTRYAAWGGALALAAGLAIAALRRNKSRRLGGAA